MSDIQKPDFINLAKIYKSLTNRQRAEIRRAVEPEALLDIPGFYHFIRKAGLKPNAQSCRMVWFLPFVDHQDKAVSIGKIMATKKVNERRLFQVVRSEYPNDLIQLQRILRQIKPELNWKDFGSLLYYWGQTKEGSKKSKQILMKDYFLTNETKEQKGESHE
ncbi:MAG: type I-E CRISPR-associated protein Cse2/CasB [Thermodesulfovibrionia bacterium]|nr:type I-E CRISPR-associated protein Cse2/CasB [Thermodesulfovibrionia bacterium]